MLVKECPHCNSKIHLYAEHTENEEVIIHCCKPNCGWQSNPIPRHLTGEVKTIREIKEIWN